jgi:hypothetical protein
MRMTHDVTIATSPDRRTVAALSRSLMEPDRMTACLRRASSWFGGGVRVVEAQCVRIPFDRDRSRSFSVCGEIRLPEARTWTLASEVAGALALELRRAGFRID